MTEPVSYKYLQPERGSKYRQLAVNGRIRAEILYRETVGTEPLTPEQVAKEYNLPAEAVREAVHYCEHNRDLLDAERAREQAAIEANGLDRWGRLIRLPANSHSRRWSD
jgi:hypothetical protein